MGKEIYSGTIEASSLSTDQSIDLPGSAPGGVYLLHIQQGNRQIREKVVLQN
jgi:hypothetical protein